MTDYQRPRSDGGGLDACSSVTSEANSSPAIGAALSDGDTARHLPSDVAGGADNLAKRIHDAKARGRKVRQIILYGVTNATTLPSNRD